MELGRTQKIVAAFCALALATLASGFVINGKALDLLYLEIVLFVMFMALDLRERNKFRAQNFGERLKEDVLMDSRAHYYPGEEDDVLDRGNPGWDVKGRLLLTRTRVLFDADEPSGGVSLPRQSIVLALKGTVMQDGRKVGTGFSGVLVAKTKDNSYKFFVEGVDGWMKQLRN
ncbi:MAG: hypothetical protein V1787_05095 [Candidatus Micrarchaeota archaeon]